MDVGELLTYQPSSSLDEADEQNEAGGRRAKRRKVGDELADIDLDNLGEGPPPLDEAALKRLLLQFERKVLKNQELRVKFADNPTKFMDSEVELFDCIQEMHVLSTQPELYRIIVEMNIVQTMLGLLSHENTDVACSIAGLLQELSDLDNVDEMEDVSVLLEALIDGQIVAQLVSNIERLDETVKEEAEGVYNSLAIIENLTDYKPDLSKDAQPLIAWILKRLRAKMPFDGNKLYASEILSILMQNNDDNRKLLGSLEGVDALLQQLAVSVCLFRMRIVFINGVYSVQYYKRHDPASGDEQEYMENLYDCLCSSLLCCPSNRELFFKGEGLELMNLILKEKRKSNSKTSVQVGALKVINHVLSSDKGRDEILENCCNRFIEVHGLGVLCPILMKPRSMIGAAKKREAASTLDDVEEHCLSIVLALLKYCKPENKKRIVNKFIEKDYEKTERLVELHFKYAEKLSKCDAQIKKERTKLIANDEEIDEDQLFMRRLAEGGLFTLQLIDFIILQVSALHDEHLAKQSSQSSSDSIKARVMKQINLHAHSSVNHYKLIKSVAKEMAEEQTDEQDKALILQLVDQF